MKTLDIQVGDTIRKGFLPYQVGDVVKVVHVAPPDERGVINITVEYQHRWGFVMRSSFGAYSHTEYEKADFS